MQQVIMQWFDEDENRLTSTFINSTKSQHSRLVTQLQTEKIHLACRLIYKTTTTTACKEDQCCQLSQIIWLCIKVGRG